MADQVCLQTSWWQKHLVCSMPSLELQASGKAAVSCAVKIMAVHGLVTSNVALMPTVPATSLGRLLHSIPVATPLLYLLPC